MKDLKRMSIWVMVGGLIAAALLAVVAVLVGEFNDVFARALGTIGLVTIHALASLAYAQNMENKSGRGMGFFQNTAFVIIVLSFFTSVFGIWEAIPGDIVGRLYLTYGVFLFASLHGSALAETTNKTSTTDKIVFTNYAFMSLVVVMLILLIWLNDTTEFGDFYYRLLAAFGIVDATLTILAIILDKLYLQKHPKAQSVLFSVTPTGQVGPDGQAVPTTGQAQVVTQRKTHPLIWLLGLFIAAQIVLSVIGMIMGNIAKNRAMENYNRKVEDHNRNINSNPTPTRY